MRVCLFGDGSNVHLRRWATDVAARGCQVAVLSVGPAPPISGVLVHAVASGPAVVRRLALIPQATYTVGHPSIATVTISSNE